MLKPKSDSCAWSMPLHFLLGRWFQTILTRRNDLASNSSEIRSLQLLSYVHGCFVTLLCHLHKKRRPSWTPSEEVIWMSASTFSSAIKTLISFCCAALFHFINLWRTFLVWCDVLVDQRLRLSCAIKVFVYNEITTRTYQSQAYHKKMLYYPTKIRAMHIPLCRAMPSKL